MHMVIVETKWNFHQSFLIWPSAEFCVETKIKEFFPSQYFLSSCSLTKKSLAYVDYKTFQFLTNCIARRRYSMLFPRSTGENLNTFFLPHCWVKFASYHLLGSVNSASAFASSLSSFILWLCRCVCESSLLRSAWACW